jgi:hypothetical protein
VQLTRRQSSHRRPVAVDELNDTTTTKRSGKRRSSRLSFWSSSIEYRKILKTTVKVFELNGYYQIYADPS